MSNRTIHVSLGYHDGFYGVFLGGVGGWGGGVISYNVLYSRNTGKYKIKGRQTS